MEQMVRKQIYIRKRQNALLKRQAKLRGMSEAELIRRALEQELTQHRVSRFQPDASAFQQFQEFIQRHRNKAQGKPYRWQREDAYEERMQRLGH